MTIADNLAAVRVRIDQACLAAGREPSSVRLLPVSKTHPLASIYEANEAGYHLFGENKVQEMSTKNAELDVTRNINWSLIGHLQTNKVRQAVKCISEFQALDSLKLASALNHHLVELDRRVDVFIQVNSSGEESKFGLPPQKVVEFAKKLSAFEQLNVVGLMTLALFSQDEQKVSACFKRMLDVQRELREKNVLGVEWNELSMGMSGDFELAISHGATVVRIGEAIFGRRPRPKN